MDSMIGDDEGLWEELHHHENRERHHYQIFSSSSSNMNNNTIISNYYHPMLENFIFQSRIWVYYSIEEMKRVGHVFYYAATSAYQESQNKLRIIQQENNRRYRYHNVNNNSINTTTTTTTTTRIITDDPHAYLDEFGIPKDDPLLQMEHQQSDHYISLEEANRSSNYYNYNNNNNNQNNIRKKKKKNDYVQIPTLYVRPENDGYASISNLDIYFQSLYNYYYHRGLIPIICKGVVEIITLYFTLLLSIFLFIYIDWYKLIQCTDENTCYNNFINNYINTTSIIQRNLTIFNCIIILYVIIFFIYGIISIISFINTIQNAKYTKYIYEEKLGISDRKLLGGAIDWDHDIVSKLTQLQSTGQYRIFINNDNNNTSNNTINALMIANRILRKENFMIALFNRGLLDLSVPFTPLAGKTFYCSSIEWSIYFCVLSYMFNHKYEIRPSFYLDSESLKRRFQLCGIVHIIFMPFLLFFVTIYFGLQNIYDWKSTKQYLGPRDWSQQTKWIFREYNELQHFYERRLSPSYTAAESYLKLFGSNEIITAIGRVLVFISGSLGAVLFAFAAINDAILLHVKIADWNLLWYAGVFGVMYSTGKSLIPNPEALQPKSAARNLYKEIDDALANVASHTHYFPDVWKNRGWEDATYKAFTNMFQYKAKLFIMEVLSLILAPYILCVSLARCAEPICEFVLAIKTEIPGSGEVCGYATFDFEKFHDERFDGRTIGTDNDQDLIAGSLADSIIQTGNVDQSKRMFPTPKARYGKMEKSFFSFKDAHPSWSCSPSGQTLVDQVARAEREAAEAAAARSREQELHRLAAARQLETLERIEEGRTVDSSSAVDAVAAIDESYIPTADAGAGTGTRRHP